MACQHRKSRKERIPEKLWEMTRGLRPYYKKSTICKALQLSGGKFNKYCIAFDAEKAVIPEDGFAVGAFEAVSFYDETCKLTLKGLHKSLEIKTNIRNVAHVLSLMEGHL